MSKRRPLLLVFAMLCTVPVAGCGRGPGGPAIATDPNAVVSSPFASCSFFFRDGQGGPEQVATLAVAPGQRGVEPQASAVLGDFRVRVSEGSEPAHVSGQVSVWVAARTAPEGDWIARTPYPLDSPNPSLEKGGEGGHGFTGLDRVRHPQSGTELQWLCKKLPYRQ